MKEALRAHAERTRSELRSGALPPANFRAALVSVPPMERDAWLDFVFGLEEVPDDGPELPPGCVPYLPCPVDALVTAFELAELQASDTFVDIGCGTGRAALLAHVMTGASSIGVEVQPTLAREARTLAQRFEGARISVMEGDAAQLTGQIPSGTVFFLYCPFSGDRLEQVLDGLEATARTRQIRICTVNLPPLTRPWLLPVSSGDERVAVYRSSVRLTSPG